MAAGTITLTNNSSAVAGAGTAFTTELKANDFFVAVVGGVAYTLGIDSVDSDTSLTLIRKFTGPTASGLSWSAVPAKTMTRITAEMSEQITFALRGQNLDKANWQQVFTGTGTITVNLSDGSSFTGPAWNSFTSQLETLNENIENKVGDTTPLGLLSTAIKSVNSTSKAVEMKGQIIATADGGALVVKPATTGKSATLQGVNSAGVGQWDIGNVNDGTDLVIRNNNNTEVRGSSITLSGNGSSTPRATVSGELYCGSSLVAAGSMFSAGALYAGYDATTGGPIAGDSNVVWGTTSLPATTTGRRGVLAFTSAGWQFRRTQQDGSGVAAMLVPGTAGTLAVASSDSRLKTDIESVTDVDLSVERIDALRPVTFKWNEVCYPGDDPAAAKARLRHRRGFIAQELNAIDESYAIAPETDDQFWGWESSGIIADLVLYVRESKRQIEELKKEVAELKSGS
ncbi:tail fiber domain-containing protein [Winslowiella arboricola]|uniref:tail fiber domain-containing protein n=1 Tax=Winslowiella arboricola TaxID=2978220 RepID=UPI00225E5669|nr:tail fiber domain-containing protein [Winslowiella arboricola]MCU5775242.1 tail fiber domain-containing protein [Winslowiella arboricola]